MIAKTEFDFFKDVFNNDLIYLYIKVIFPQKEENMLEN
jgi:hypothetical protein